ncbi:MAG: thiamine biosynthesis protein ThiS [Rickettsiales bacterium]|nr:thiamine biosynthesis protein ThiS [Rickettsiales bacterium]
MHITLNGEDHTVAPDSTLAGLLATLELDLRSIAVERNGKIIPRTLHDQTPLSTGDHIEIVEFIGGG